VNQNIIYICFMDKIFKIFGWLACLFFIASAVLQYNDPDPWLWIIIYLIAAIVSLFVVLGRISYLVPLILGILALAGSYYVFPAKFEGFEIGAGDIKNIEEGREAVGLIISAIIMFIFSYRTRIKGRL